MGLLGQKHWIPLTVDLITVKFGTLLTSENYTFAVLTNDDFAAVISSLFAFGVALKIVGCALVIFRRLLTPALLVNAYRFNSMYDTATTSGLFYCVTCDMCQYNHYLKLVRMLRINC